LQDIIQKTIIEIRKYGFGDDVGVDVVNKPRWTDVQFFQVMNKLAKKDVVSYDELKWSPFFKGSDGPLHAMENAELITVVHRDGRPFIIRPGKPVYLTAFACLLSDQSFAATMQLQSYQYLSSIETAKIRDYEGELRELSTLYNGRLPRETDARRRFLLQSLQASQKKIDLYEHEIDQCKELIAKGVIE